MTHSGEQPDILQFIEGNKAKDRKEYAHRVNAKIASVKRGIVHTTIPAGKPSEGYKPVDFANLPAKPPVYGADPRDLGYRESAKDFAARKRRKRLSASSDSQGPVAQQIQQTEA